MLTGDVRKMVSRITSISQDHYPETMGKMCIINAPMAFRAIWGMVKPMLQPRTINKITILGYKYMDELTKYIAIEHIPEYMGGQSPHTLLDDAGPWNDPALLSTLNMITEDKEAESEAPSRKRVSGAPPTGASAWKGSSGRTDTQPVHILHPLAADTLPMRQHCLPAVSCWLFRPRSGDMPNCSQCCTSR
jgi:CRAL/TRIO domain